RRRPEGPAEPDLRIPLVRVGEPPALAPGAAEVVGEPDRAHAVAGLGVDGFHLLEARRAVGPEPFFVSGIVRQCRQGGLAQPKAVVVGLPGLRLLGRRAADDDGGQRAGGTSRCPPQPPPPRPGPWPPTRTRCGPLRPVSAVARVPFSP